MKALKLEDFALILDISYETRDRGAEMLDRERKRMKKERPVVEDPEERARKEKIAKRASLYTRPRNKGASHGELTQVLVSKQ